MADLSLKHRFKSYILKAWDNAINAKMNEWMKENEKSEDTRLTS